MNEYTATLFIKDDTESWKVMAKTRHEAFAIARIRVAKKFEKRKTMPNFILQVR